MKKAVIGLDVGGTKVLGALYDEESNPISKEKKSTKASKGEEKILSQIAKVIRKLLETATEEEYEVKGIGAGVPGVINEGQVLFTPNLPWRMYPLAKLLEDEFNIPVLIGNDANVSLYGEWAHGVARGTKNVVGFFVGTGVGGGIIIDKKIYSGSIGLAGEIGHITMNPDGVICGCGSKGCLESYSSKTGILKYVKGQIEHGRDSSIKADIEEDPEHFILRSKDIKKALEEEDPVMEEAIETAAKYLGIATATSLSMLNPEMVIYGGGIMEAIGDIMIEKLKPYIVRYAVPHSFDHCELKLSELEDDACIIGAMSIVEDKMK